MRRDEVEKLLGGFATGTLTGVERAALFQAALRDQALFDALADEQALKEVIEDPECRRRLLDALATEPEGLWTRLFGLWRRPAAWALAGSVAGGVLIFAVLRHQVVPAPEVSQVRIARDMAQEAKNEPALVQKPSPGAPVEKRVYRAPAKGAPAVRAEVRKEVVVKQIEPEAPRAATPPPPVSERIATWAKVGGAAMQPGVVGGIMQKETLATRFAARQADTASPLQAERQGKNKTEADRKDSNVLRVAMAPPPPPPPVAQVAAESAAVATPMQRPTAPAEVSVVQDRRADASVAQNVMLRAAAPVLSCVVLHKQSAREEYQAVASDAILSASESIRLSVVPPAVGKVSVFERRSSGAPRLLYSSGAKPLRPGVAITIPETGAFSFPDASGEKTLLVVFANPTGSSFAAAAGGAPGFSTEIKLRFE
jgi:hypothetical protein